MPKTRNPSRKRLHPDDVLAGRGRPPSAREIIDLIHEVNPSGLDLPDPDVARRYALKSRLQSLLIRRFESEIEVEPDPRAEGVVSLRHRPLDADACHAVVQELDEASRSWVKRQVDLQAFRDGAERAPPRSSPARKPKAGSAASKPPAQPCELALPELLRAGQDAIDAYDYDLARGCLLRAFEEGHGNVEAALPLLCFLVDHLAADQEALLLEAHLAPAALRLPEVRRLLALAAARGSERDRALALIKDQQDPAAADVYIALARAALDAGDLDRAASDLAQAQALCPAHGSLAGLSAMVTERRARERRPLEDDLARLLAERRLDEAEAHGHSLLARFPDSTAAQKALRRIEELRAEDRFRHLIALAGEALARGEAVQARSWFHIALATGVRAEEAARVQEAARIQKELAEIDAAERAAAERAQEERVARLLGDADLTPGLLAYIALDGPPRSRVREQVSLIHLEWLDGMAVEGSGARARAAAAAVLALHRADKIAADEPALALELLGTHAKLLRGLERSEQVAAVARHHLEMLAREQAARRLEAAREAFKARAVERARELLAGVALEHLSERDRDSAAQVHAQIEDTLAIRGIDRLVRDGAVLRARRDADKLLQRLQGENERALLAATRRKLDDSVRTVFRIRVDPTPRPFTSHRYLDLCTPNGAPRVLHPESGELVLIASRGVWVFLRVIDLASRTIRLRLTLRTPAPLDLLKAEVDGSRLVLIGQFAFVLELSFTDWTVLGWHERLGFETSTSRYDPTAAQPESLLPSGRTLDYYFEYVGDEALVPGTTLLWLSGVIKSNWYLRIVDLSSGRVLRDFSDSLGYFGVRAVQGLDRPYLLVVRHGEDSVTLYEPNGLPLEGSRTACAAFDQGIVTYPGERKTLLFTGESAKRNEGGALAPIRFCTLTPDGGMSAERVLFEDQASTENLTAAVDAERRMVFVQLETPGGGRELAGFRAHGGSDATLERMFRVCMPLHAAMIQGGHGQGALLLARTHEGIDVFQLGAHPPAFRPGPRSVDIRVGDLSFLGSHRCRGPVGIHRPAVVALGRAMAQEPRAAWAVRIERAKQENDADQLMELTYALELNHCPTEAATLGAWTLQRHPDHAEARLAHARALGNVEAWTQLRDLLAPVDPSVLDGRSAQHMHHLLGVALLHLGETEEALRVLQKGASYPEGRCRLSVMLALATPLPEPGDPDDAVAWDAQQATVRTLMHAVRAADGCLGRGDAAGAKRVIDRWEVWEASEVQSLARLAETYLLDEEVAEDERFDKAFALSSFCAAHAEKMVLTRRELPIPQHRWDMAKLDELSARATEWLDRNLGEALPMPPGGL